ncbi:MAG TPA: exodeoxyribonuclease VII small subunit [Candidatus Binataceae bacterium]|nr:exodeoxyribonuclease VII small subunit [Candidatus Binataceae bacterium]
MEDDKVQSFEEEFDELENVVTRIDTGELSLEESITAFERGVALVRSLNRKLDEVDRRIEVLTCDTDGDLRLSSYNQDEEAGADDGSINDEDEPF